MWYKSKIIIPPARKDIYIWKDGKCQMVNMDSYDIYDGKGGLHPDLFEYWSNQMEEKEPA